MKSLLDMVLQDVPLDDFEIQIRNVRCKYPTAELYPNMSPPLIVITGNKPSLIRYALANLLLHEQAHHKFHKKYYKYKGDHHSAREFQRIERELLGQLDGLIVVEHD
jgi:hypothetical protein